ncbi:complement decay-accelerating factor-like isoform X14 [Carassius carassius]|uniref:complement decay-accelerating factor-like isoform X14 n=1 Tax=Carassius carassius TaxID=217509 RepID=UPI00286939F3|nr:complement decay-accelerating factor-like isoform X14 [Carassius carassius]
MTSVKVLPLLLLALSLVSAGAADCSFPVFNGKIVLSSESLLKNSFPDNSEALVECAKGYEREEGLTSIICLNGMWSQVKLICKKIDCGEPKPSLHMSYDTSEGTLFGAYIKTICEKGYDLEGSSYRQCLVSGWSGKAECILTTCEVPDAIEHGKMIVPRVIPEFNDVITFSCDDNYILVGNSTITCGEYGDYSSPPPTCIVITTPTEASTTTDKATTTDMTTASTRSHEGLIEGHTTDFNNDLVGFVAPLTMKASLATTLIITVLLIIAFHTILVKICRQKKSYCYIKVFKHKGKQSDGSFALALLLHTDSLEV